MLFRSPGKEPVKVKEVKLTAKELKAAAIADRVFEVNEELFRELFTTQ